MAEPLTFATASVHDCHVVELPRQQREAASVTRVMSLEGVPFSIERVYYLYDVPGGETRGGHAHRALSQLIVAALGSFDVVIDDGRERKTVHLRRSFHGLLLVPGIWRELTNFSSGAISLVLASRVYEESDYIRDYDRFLDMKTR